MCIRATNVWVVPSRTSVPTYNLIFHDKIWRTLAWDFWTAIGRYHGEFGWAWTSRTRRTISWLAFAPTTLPRSVDSPRFRRSLFLSNVLFFMKDIWWLVWGIFLVAIIERKNLMDPNKPWFNLFAIIFELVSAFGSVGLSLGFPNVASFLLHPPWLCALTACRLYTG